jgi:probable O-glycosylation ligase (exosortase A-associated)
MRDLALAGVLLPLLMLGAVRPFVGILVWSWISFMNPHREVFSFAQSVPWAMLSIISTACGCLVAREPKKPAINALTLLMLLFMVCITVTSITALGPPSAVWAKWEHTTKVFIGLLLTASLLTDRWRVHALVWLIAISMGFYGVKGGIFTVVTGGGFKVLGPDDSMIGDTNHIALAMLIAIPLMNYLREQSPHHVIRLGLIGAMVSTLLAVLGTQSRGGFIAVGAVAGVMWLRSRGKLISGIAIAACLAAAITFMPDSWVERMRTIQTYDQDNSANQRFRIWGIALAIFQLRPWVGGGFKATYYAEVVNLVAPGEVARAVHNMWLEILAEHGAVTFAVWLGMLAAGIFYSLGIARLARSRAELRWAYDLARMMQVSIVGYCVGGTFLSLAYWDIFWTMMVVLGAVHGMVRQAVKAPAAAPAGAVAARPLRGPWRPARSGTG